MTDDAQQETKEKGRKYRIVMISVGFFLMVNLGVVAKIWVGSKLDVETMLQVALGVAALAGAYAGANAWAKQSEAKVEVAKIETQGIEPEDV